MQTLIIANIAVFLAEMVFGDRLFVSFALWPLGVHFLPWQVVTYAFLHGGIEHLAFNMFGLWMFGRELEYLLGGRRFMRLYFASVLTAAAAQLFVASLSGGVYPTVGASGAIFGLLFAYASLFPNRTVMLLFPPIPMPARVFAIGYAGLELFLGVTGSQAGVAHFAHLGGMLGGYLVLRYDRGWRR